MLQVRTTLHLAQKPLPDVCDDDVPAELEEFLPAIRHYLETIRLALAKAEELHTMSLARQCCNTLPGSKSS